MKFRWNEVTALFGGTFDPPHMGHHEAVRGLFEVPGVGKVRVLPTPQPPHKTSIATLEQRLEMTHLNFTSTFAHPLPSEDITIDCRELKRAARAPHCPTYTFDTLKEIRRDFPNLAFVIGTDQLEKFDTWHRFPEILSLSHWIVLLRRSHSPTQAGTALQRLAAGGLMRKQDDRTWQTREGTRVHLVETSAPALSSTSIREAISKTGMPLNGTLLPEVHTYLKLHRIYGTK